MLSEYEFASRKGGVRAKYLKRLRHQANIVVLEPEVAEAFPNQEAVNEALRGVLDTARAPSDGPAALPTKHSIRLDQSDAKRRKPVP
jgi:hypothetical protein